MGTSIYQKHSAETNQPREACAKACILCWWRGKDALSLGCRSIAALDTRFTLPLLFGSHHLYAEYQPQRLCLYNLGRWDLLSGVCILHIYANILARQPIQDTIIS